jgi:transposase-like protein
MHRFLAGRRTYVLVNGVWTSRYRAVGSLGQTIEFLLSVRRGGAAAKRLFRKALAQRIQAPADD